MGLFQNKICSVIAEMGYSSTAASALYMHTSTCMHWVTPFVLLCCFLVDLLHYFVHTLMVYLCKLSSVFLSLLYFMFE